MLTLKILLLTLMSSNLFFRVFANDPGFCNNEPVCKPCNCNAGGKCQGFCHHDVGGTNGPKHCDTQAMGCKCPPTNKMALAGVSFVERRGGCTRVGRVVPRPDCSRYGNYFDCEITGPDHCKWDPDIRICYSIGGGKASTKKDPTKSIPTKKDPTKKDPTQKVPTKKVPT
ncbi:hypothetical protein CDEST_02069 [Colletotrichum destructivum]|uniref:Uncharacterized protein n=1 Tax=Colletotrichum destructivum TaxID=34406 RepID=A0AAX4I271_9PEZI|nr:hypothetical protein CDEST_02069 [Colletotrichum destructivum]